MYKKYFKRLLDLFLGLILLIICILPMILIWLIIKISSNGPAIFNQERLGKNEKKFCIYKFRTMIIQTEEKNRILTDDERVTKIGKVLRKLSLDELPQILNVVKGDMSFIGPRPFIIKDLKDFTDKEITKRMRLKPGITGLAQVNGRNHLSFREKLEYDLFYVEQVSFVLDLKVLIKTFLVVIKRRGVDKKQNCEVIDEFFETDFDGGE